MDDTEDAGSTELTLAETVHDLIQVYQAVRKRIATLFRGAEFGIAAPVDRSLYATIESSLREKVLAPEELADVTRLVVRHIDLFGTYIENLNGYMSRTDTHTLKLESISIPVLIAEVVALFEPLAAEKGVDINLSQQRDMPNIVGDWALLYRVFSNVMDNAVKYSFSRSSKADQRYIQVSSRRHSLEGMARVSIASYGVGITPEEISSGVLFEYGRRGEMARDRERHGNGIGLSETRRILDAHGGTITLSSRAVAENTPVHVTKVEVVLLPEPPTRVRDHS